jgi:colanic acid/amylovoran biosynthesis glycosyltransferase
MATVKYICTNLSPGIAKSAYVQVIPFYENKLIKKIRWLLWKYDLFCSFKNRKYATKINSVINEFNPDIIHCHFAYEALMLLDNLENLQDRKIIIHLHGYDASKMLRKKSYVKRLKYYLTQNNIFTISCNNYFIRVLNDHYKINISSHLVLKYGINVNSLFKRGVNNSAKDHFVFTQVSSLVEKKGHEYTLQSYKRFIQLNPEIKSVLKFTGEGERLTAIKKLVKALDLEKNVEFLGVLSPQQIALLLDNTDVFLHHSVVDKMGDMEGIPNAIMEAMAMELPVLSTVHSGIPELVVDGLNGFLVEEKDIVQYSIRMKDTLNMGKLTHNRTKILNEYNVKSHNELLQNFYNKCINKE